MKNIIIHIATEKYVLSSDFTLKAKLLEEFSSNNNIHNIVFYQSDSEPPILLNSHSVEIHNYKTKEELIDRVLLIGEKEKIIFVNTFQEILVLDANELKEKLGQKISLNLNVFKDKSILRELLEKNDISVSVKSIKVKYGELNFDKLEKSFGLPFVIKPINGAECIGVSKIKNKKQFDKYIEDFSKGKDIIKVGCTDDVLVEEFIDGDLFTIDYYVDENGEAFISKPINEKDGCDLGDEDFFVFARIASKKIEEEVNFKKLKEFISKTIKALGIRNTFINHEFKINSKGEFKNIEINGRLGWKRLQLYDLAYQTNLFSLIIKKDTKFDLKENVSLLKLYSCKDGVFKEYNKKLLDEVEELDSYYKINLEKDLIGKEVGLSKDGYPSIASIFLVNKSFKELKKDIDFVCKNFCSFAEF